MRGSIKPASQRRNASTNSKSPAASSIKSPKRQLKSLKFGASPFTLSERHLITTTLTARATSQLFNRRRPTNGIVHSRTRTGASHNPKPTSVSAIVTGAKRHLSSNYGDSEDDGVPRDTPSRGQRKRQQPIAFDLDWGMGLDNDKAPNAKNSTAQLHTQTSSYNDFFGGDSGNDSYSDHNNSSGRKPARKPTAHFNGVDDSEEDGIPLQQSGRRGGVKRDSTSDFFAASLQRQKNQPPLNTSQRDHDSVPSPNFSSPKQLKPVGDQYDDDGIPLVSVRQPKMTQNYQHRDFTPYSTHNKNTNTTNQNNNFNQHHTKPGFKEDQPFRSNQRRDDRHNGGFYQEHSLPEQKFDTMDADHDMSRSHHRGGFGGGYHDKWGQSEHDRNGGSKWSQGKQHFKNNNNNNNTTASSKRSTDIDYTLLAGPIAIALKRLPTHEQLQYAIKRYLPFRPLRIPLGNFDHLGHPLPPQSKHQVPRHNHTKNTFGIANPEDEANEIVSNNDILSLFSRLIESVRASHSTSHNSGTNHDSVHAHLGGRLNNAISSVFTAYRSRGLLLFVDVFHPFLNIVHWTRIFNSLILAKNYHTAVDLFEKFLLPNDISPEQQEIIDQINNPLNSTQSRPRHSPPSPAQASNPHKIATNTLQQQMLLTAVDQKLMTGIITAYTRCRQPAELLSFLSTLERLDLLPDPSATKHLLTTICSNPGDYNAEVTLFNSTRFGGGESHPFYKNSLVHPNITFSMLMSFYHNFRKQSLLKLVSNDQSTPKPRESLVSMTDDRAKKDHGRPTPLTKKPLSKPKVNHPLATVDQFIHHRGQLLQYSNMYSELGFLSALHGSLSESLKHQGMIALPNITSLLNLGIKMNRIDLVYGLVQNRYKYYTRHVGVGQEDVNRSLSSFFSNQSLHCISLPWANIHIPSSPLTEDSAGNDSSSTAEHQEAGAFVHAKDHFTHTVDYDNINLTELGVDTPVTTVVEKAGEFDDVIGGKITQSWGHQLSKNTQPLKTNTNPTPKSTTRTLTFPKFPSQKRFVMVQTGFGMGVEVYVNNWTYYKQHGVKDLGKKKAQQQDSEPADETPAQDDKFNPFSLIASITPSSNRFTSGNLPPPSKVDAPFFHSLNPSLSTGQRARKPSQSQLHILRHLQPDPVMIVSLRPKANNKAPLAVLSPKSSVPIHKKINRRRRHVIDTELKRRQNVYVSDENDENDENQNNDQNSVSISIMSIVPKTASSTQSSIPSPHSIQKLKQLLSEFSLRSTSTPLLESKSSTKQFFNALAQNRSYGLLAKASTFYTHHHHVYKRRGAKQTDNIIVGKNPDSSNQTENDTNLNINSSNLTPGPTQIVQALLHNDIFNNLVLTPSGQILNPQLRLLSRLNPHFQPQSGLTSDNETDDVDSEEGHEKAKKALSRAQLDSVSNLSPFSPISFTPSSLSNNLTNSPFDGIYVGTSLTDLVKKKAKRVSKPKFQVPLFLSPFLIHYEDSVNHTDDQAELQAVLHLMTSYPNTMDSTSLKREFSVGNDPQNGYYLPVPSLSAQLQLQYPHIHKTVGKTALTNLEIVNGQQMVRPGVAVARRILLGLLTRIVNSQTKATNRIFNQYQAIVTEVIDKEDSKLQRRTHSGFRDVKKNKGLKSGQTQVTLNPTDDNDDDNDGDAGIAAVSNPQTMSELDQKLSELTTAFPMSNWYVSNESNPNSGSGEELKDAKHPAAQSHSTSSQSQPHKHIYLSTTALHELKQDVGRWVKHSDKLSRDVLNFVRNYSSVPHPEVVDEYLNTILPFLIDLTPQLNFNPKFTQEIIQIGVDLSLKSHFTSIMTPTPLNNFRTKRAAAQATVDFAQEETDFITALDAGRVAQLVGDSYLNSLGLPSTSQLSYQVINAHEGDQRSNQDEADSNDASKQAPFLRSSPNCSFSTPNTKTAPSALHTKLLKLLATLSETTKGTTVELSAQLELASYISNEFSQRGDLNSTLIWATMAAHMKQNINKTLERELRAGFVKSNKDIPSSPFSVIAAKIRPAQTPSELLKPVDQSIKLAMDEVSLGSTEGHEGYEGHEGPGKPAETADTEDNFHNTIQQHFDEENAQNKAHLDEVSRKVLKKKQDKVTSLPYLPMSFYPAGTMSPDFILHVNESFNGQSHADGGDQAQQQNSPELVLPSPFVQNFPFSIKPISNLGEILQLIPDTSLTSDTTGGNAKAGSKLNKTQGGDRIGKTLQQSLRSFEHALMLSESSSPLPHLMPSLVYLHSLQTIFQAVVYSNLTNLGHFQSSTHNHDGAMTANGTTQPHLAEFSSVVNSSFAAYRIFWHLLGSFEQKQIQHTIGIDTGALLKQAVPTPGAHSAYGSRAADEDDSETDRRNFIYPASSPALVTSLDQFLGQFDHFNLGTTLAQLLTVGSKLAQLPPPHRRAQSRDDDDDDDAEAELKRESDTFNAQQSLLTYTDTLIGQIIDIWEPPAPKARVNNNDTNDNNSGDSPVQYQDLLELESPFSLNSQEPSLYGKYNEYLPDNTNPNNRQSRANSNNNSQINNKGNDGPQGDGNKPAQPTIYDPTVQSGPLSFAKPTPALIAAMNTYVTDRLRQGDVKDAHGSSHSITLNTFSRIQRAAKRFITNHSPNTLQQLEAFKMHRDHQKATALGLIGDVVDQPEVVDFLQQKRRAAENGSARIDANQQWSQYDGNDQDIATATDFAIVTPTTGLELEIDMVLEQIQTDPSTLTTTKHNELNTVQTISTSDLDQLSHGQYPYPLTLTLSKTSSISFQHSKKDVSSENSSDGAYPSIDGHQTSSDGETGSSVANVDQPRWFPDRSGLLSQLTQDGNSDVIKLNETGASIRLDSHLNSYDAISTLFNVTASLRSHIESTTSRLNALVDESARASSSTTHTSPNYNLHDDISSLEQRLGEVSRRHQQAEFLLKLLSKSQNDSYLDLLTEQMTAIKHYHLSSDGVNSSPAAQGSAGTKENRAKTYFPVPYFSTNNTNNDDKADKAQSSLPMVAATFSFQDYHNNIVKSCFDALDGVLETRQKLKEDEVIGSHQQQQPNPALFLFQPNRTLTAKEAMAFELFLDTLE